MVYSGLAYAIQNRSWEALWSIAVLLVGAALGLFDRKLPGDAHGTSLNPDP
jgi:hypothetical protein